MKIKSIFHITFLLIYFCYPGFSQTTYGVIPPADVKKSCDSVIISEIGKIAFENNVRYFKCDAGKGIYNNGEGWTTYTLFYSFNFTDVKESHIIFSLIFKTDPYQSGIMKDVAFKNYTRLPESIQKKGIKIIDYAEAQKIAMKADPVLGKNAAKLDGEISTEYDVKKKEYRFVWYFYYRDPCRNCEAEMYTVYSALINASTGKVITVNINGE